MYDIDRDNSITKDEFTTVVTGQGTLFTNFYSEALENPIWAIFEMLGPDGIQEIADTPQSRVDKIFAVMDKVEIQAVHI